VAVIVICAELSLVAIAPVARMTMVPPADPEESWLEMIDQVPDTAVQLAPGAPSARLKSSLKLVTAPSPSCRADGGYAAELARAKSATLSVNVVPSGVIATSCLVSGMICVSVLAVSGL
jgi:hypothetical protein